MAQAMVVRPRRGLIARMRESIRGITLGPWSPKDKTIARYFSDGPRGLSGVSVTEDTALSYAAFWQGVGLIAGHIASFPLIPYKRIAQGGKERQTGTRLYRLLHDEFNPHMSAFVGKELMQAHALTWGNGYAEIERNTAGQPIALWPLTPDRVTPFYAPDGSVAYKVAPAMNYGSEVVIPASDMIHVPGIGYDGLCGYGVVRKARESIGLGMAAERFGSAFFGNGSTFGGILTAPVGATFEDEDEDDLRASIEKFHQGVDRAHRFLILHGGLSYQNLGIPPKDAEFLETRKFQIEEVARWLNLPPHKLKHLDRSTNNNIEHQGIEYYTDSLWPWQVRWEQELNRKLIPALERNQQFIEFLPDAVLRGDIESRYRAYAIGRQWGWLSADDVRDRENMNALPNGSGKMYMVPINMAPADRINDIIDAQVTPPNPPPVQEAKPTRMDPEAVAALLRDEIAQIASAVDVQSARVAEAEAARTASQLEAEVLRMAREQDQTVLEACRRELSDKQELLQMATERAEADAAARAAAEAVARAAEVERDRATADRDGAITREADALHELVAATTASAEERAKLQAASQDAIAAREASELLVVELDRQVADAHRQRDELASRRETYERDLDAIRAALTAAEARAGAAQERSEQATTEVVKAGEREAHAIAELAGAQGAAETLQRRIAALEAERDATVEAFAHRERLAEEATLALHESATNEAQAIRAELATVRTDLAVEQERRRQQHGVLIAAMRSLFVDATARLLQRESDRARKHQATPEKLRTWMEQFYPLHAEICRQTFQPLVGPWTAVVGGSPSVLLERLVRDHIETSQMALRAVVEHDDPDVMAGTLERTLRRWEDERADTVADAVLREGMESHG